MFYSLKEFRKITLYSVGSEKKTMTKKAETPWPDLISPLFPHVSISDMNSFLPFVKEYIRTKKFKMVLGLSQSTRQKMLCIPENRHADFLDKFKKEFQSALQQSSPRESFENMQDSMFITPEENVSGGVQFIDPGRFRSSAHASLQDIYKDVSEEDPNPKVRFNV